MEVEVELECVFYHPNPDNILVPKRNTGTVYPALVPASLQTLQILQTVNNSLFVHPITSHHTSSTSHQHSLTLSIVGPEYPHYCTLIKVSIGSELTFPMLDQ